MHFGDVIIQCVCVVLRTEEGSADKICRENGLMVVNLVFLPTYPALRGRKLLEKSH